MKHKFTPQERCVVAAVFGHSNMGQPNPSVRRVRELFRAKRLTLDGAVVSLSGSLMESDEHYKIFMGEAKGWLRDKKTAKLEDIQATWPDLGKLFEEALSDEKDPD
jgi:hypothetical protein